MKYIFIFFFFSTSFLFANKILLIDDNQSSFNIGRTTSYYIDKDNLLLSDIQKKSFIPLKVEIPNFGFLEPTYWFKVDYKLDNIKKYKEWWLNIDYPLLDFIDVFVVQKDTGKPIMHKRSGKLLPLSYREYKESDFLFSLPSDIGKIYTLYIRVQTTSSMQVPMKIVNIKYLVEDNQTSKILRGIYYGIFLILMFYNLVTFRYTKNKVYILYILFLASFVIWQLSFDGIGLIYIWDDWAWMKEKGTSFFVVLTAFTLTIFSRSFLETNKYLPKFDKNILVPIIFILGLLSFIAIFAPYKYMIIIGAVLSVIVPIILLFMGISALKENHSAARFYVVGWALFLIGTILFAGSKFNLIPGHFMMKYAQQTGSVLEMIFLSWALAERFRILEEQHVTRIFNAKNELEKKVQKALEKERANDQLLINQSRLASMGEMIEQIAHQWRQPLNTIGLINQDLYFKMMLNKFKDEDFKKAHTQIDKNIQYMSKTIDDFRNYYNTDKQVTSYLLRGVVDDVVNIVEATLSHEKINLTIVSKDDIYVSGIRNELIQVIINIINNAKDALKEKNIENKMISIFIKEDQDNAYISILDNANGIKENIIDKIFDPYFTTKFAHQGTGIGLYMSKMIIEKNLGGSLSVNNEKNGACFKITLPLK
jgi:signal transduction histidine kinase